MYCGKCGSSVSVGDLFCKSCGATTSAPDEENSTSPRTEQAKVGQPETGPAAKEPAIDNGVPRAFWIRSAAYLAAFALVTGAAVFVGNQPISVKTVKASEIERLSQDNADSRLIEAQYQQQLEEQFLLFSECKGQTGPFIRALGDLDSRLGVGMNFSEYGAAVGDARVSYDKIRFQRLDPVCTSQVGVPAEDALNAYMRAYTTWNDCIGDLYCSNDSITPSLQGEWAKATRKLAQARRGLANIRQGTTT